MLNHASRWRCTLHAALQAPCCCPVPSCPVLWRCAQAPRARAAWTTPRAPAGRRAAPRTSRHLAPSTSVSARPRAPGGTGLNGSVSLKQRLYGTRALAGMSSHASDVAQTKYCYLHGDKTRVVCLRPEARLLTTVLLPPPHRPTPCWPSTTPHPYPIGPGGPAHYCILPLSPSPVPYSTIPCSPVSRTHSQGRRARGDRTRRAAAGGHGRDSGGGGGGGGGGRDPRRQGAARRAWQQGAGQGPGPGRGPAQPCGAGAHGVWCQGQHHQLAEGHDAEVMDSPEGGCRHGSRGRGDPWGWVGDVCGSNGFKELWCK